MPNIFGKLAFSWVPAEKHGFKYVILVTEHFVKSLGNGKNTQFSNNLASRCLLCGHLWHFGHAFGHTASCKPSQRTPKAPRGMPEVSRKYAQLLRKSCASSCAIKEPRLAQVAAQVAAQGGDLHPI